MLKSLYYTFLSFITVFKHLFKKPVTLEYPEKQKNVGEKFRGKPLMQGCIKCGTCIKVCPTKAIKLTEDSFEFDLKKCIFCGNCSFYCPVKAIKMSKDYELATDNMNDLKLIYKIEEGQNGGNK